MVAVFRILIDNNNYNNNLTDTVFVLNKDF